MHILSAVDIASTIYLRVRGASFLYQLAYLLFVSGVSFDSFQNDAVDGTICLFGDHTQA
jgi:hypothetical protein